MRLISLFLAAVLSTGSVFAASNSLNAVLNTTSSVQAANSSSYSLDRWNNVSVVCNWTVNSSSAQSFVDGDVNTSTDEITETSHGFLLGENVQLTSSGTLPGGLSLATDYYVIVVDEDTYQLASSLANANAGTQVDITSAAGGGTHTTTPEALDGSSLKIQFSNDDSTWVDSSHKVFVTATGNYSWDFGVGYKYFRMAMAMDSGDVDFTCKAFENETSGSKEGFPSTSVDLIEHDADTGADITSSWVEVKSSLAGDCSGALVTNPSTTSYMKLGVGASGQEQSLNVYIPRDDTVYVKFGGVHSGSRLVAQAPEADITTGYVLIQCVK